MSETTLRLVGGCVCADIDPTDRPCIVCEAHTELAAIAEKKRAAEACRPAFALRTATIWFVVLAYRTPEGAMVNLQAHLLTADPTGIELHAVAKAFTERQVPGAREVTLVRVERHGEAYGTAASGGGAS